MGPWVLWLSHSLRDERDYGLGMHALVTVCFQFSDAFESSSLGRKSNGSALESSAVAGKSIVENEGRMNSKVRRYMCLEGLGLGLGFNSEETVFLLNYISDLCIYIPEPNVDLQ